MESKPCPSCERGVLILRGGPGRFFPYRMFKALELPEDVQLPTCNFCEKIVFSPTLAVAFDEGMSRAFQAQLSKVISDAIGELTPDYLSQQDLERLLGVSRGYVSKLKTGKDSSPPIAALLSLLAADPVSRLKELDQLWSGNRVTAPTASPSAPVSEVDVSTRFGEDRRKRKNVIGPSTPISIAK